MFIHKPLPGAVPELKQINESGTRYYETQAGNKYPSVTTVLSEYGRKGIMAWRAKVGEEEAKKITTRASIRGTAIHKHCEDYINNTPPVIKTPDQVELFNTLKPYLHRINNVYAQELRMYSDHLRMAGTVDCIAEFDGVLTVIDFKTAKKLKEKDYIENYFMQCSAYAVMFEERFGIPINRTAVLIAVEENTPQLFQEKRDTYINKLIYYRDLYEKRMSSKKV